jgi:hypothetical protein
LLINVCAEGMDRACALRSFLFCLHNGEGGEDVVESALAVLIQNKLTVHSKSLIAAARCIVAGGRTRLN